MKRITLTLLSIFLITPCFANIHIMRETVEAVIKQKISGADAQVAALSEYNAQIKNAGGQNAGIPASGIWQVCTKAGWDISKPDGESKCRDFENTLMKYASWTFKEVCGKDDFMIKRGTGQCVGDVFSNKILGGTKVNKLIANGLSKEYARVKYSENNLVCNTKIRQTTLPPDDYVQCISMDKNMAYEFRFDSVTETTDYVINEGTESGVCKIFGLKYSPSGYSNAATLGNGQTVGSYESWNSACETTDSAICSKVNESMSRFGRSAKIGTTGSKSNKHNACVISGGSVSASNLRTAFGIDNYAFKNSGVQLNANVATQTQVCDWVKKTVKSPQITSCKCNDGFTQIYDFSGAITEIDDVLTCNINNKPVDFVFDDLSESNKKVAKGGAQGMDCMAAGGTYAGEQCINLDEQQCKLLASANLKNCPTCKRVKYQNGVCQLPSGADAENFQKHANIALIIGGAVVGGVITVATAGTAGAPVTAVVFTLVETLGAGIELGAQLKIDAIADEFLVQSNNCKSASCAKNLIKNNFQHLADSQNDFSAPEISAIDSEMARLANLIPENDDFWADIALNSLSMSDNQSGIFENWTPEQVWRAVGITLQMASIVTSVGKWIGTKAKTAVTKLSKSSKVLMDKTDDVVKAVAQTSDNVHLSAKRAQLKQKINYTNNAIVTVSDKTMATAKVESLYVIDPNMLSGEDKVYYTLWKKYAPRNQSFDDFKQMGTIEEIQKWSTNWVSWDDVERLDVLNRKRANFLLTNKDAMKIFQMAGSNSEVAEKYPEYKTILDEMEKLYAAGVPNDFSGNYSTFDPILSKKINSENGWKGKTSLQDRINITQDLATSHINTQAVDEIAVLRAKQINDLIADSPEYTRMRNEFIFLSPEQKQQFAARLIHDLESMNGIGSGKFTKVLQDTMDKNVGAFVRRTTNLLEDSKNNVVWNTYSTTTTNFDFSKETFFDDFINKIAHEGGGHVIDFENPNAGAHGAQLLNAIANDSYVGSKESEEIYRLTATEQSAYKIGSATIKMSQLSKNVFQSTDDIIDVLVNGSHNRLLIYAEMVDSKGKPLGIRISGNMIEPALRDGRGIWRLRGEDVFVIEGYFNDIKNMLNKDGLDIVRGEENVFFIKSLQN